MSSAETQIESSQSTSIDVDVPNKELQHQQSTEEDVSAVAAAVISNGFHHHDEPISTNPLGDHVQHAIRQFAELDGFVSYETIVVSGEGDLTRVQLIGTKNVNGFTVADLELPLLVRVSGDVVKVSKDYVVVARAAVDNAPVVQEVAVAPISIIIPDEELPVVHEVAVAAPIVVAPVEEVAIQEIAVVAPIAVAPEVTVEAVAEPIVVAADSHPIPDFVHKAIEEVATKQGFVSFTTDFAHNVATGDGFIGEISRATIRGNRTAPNGITHVDVELSLVIKLPPAQKFRREIAMRVFEREVFAYNVMLPTFMQFQADHGLRPGVEGFHSFPKCYYAHFDRAADQTVLILEDLVVSGFQMESKFKSLSFEYAKTVVEKLGQLHAISLALKDQRPQEFAKFKELNDPLMVEDEPTKQMMRTIIKMATEKAVATLRDDETALKERVIRAAELVPEESARYKGEFAEPYAVMGHGDCWVNNFMFKFESGHKLQLAMLDWQCTRYASPALDLLYFLFLCTDAPFRAKHYDDLLQAYHHALRAQLDRLGADFNELFPFTALLRSMKQYGRFAFNCSLIIVQMLATDRQDLPDMDEVVSKIVENDNFDGKMFEVPQKSQSVYDERMSGILRDLGKKGFL